EQPGTHEHDGFYLRILLGPGYASFNGPSTIKLSGFGVGFALDAGGAISENLIAFGQLMVNSINDPELTGARLNGTVEGTFGSQGIGAGLSYYIMPMNAFVSGSLLFASLNSQLDGEEESSSEGKGIGVNLVAGKEFWVSSNWGLGIAAQMALSRVTDDADDEWTNVGFSIGMTGTFN
ncbi:MAG TPA: hypothetical protein VGG33_24540, partial [Polyangia bacterium]